MWFSARRGLSAICLCLLMFSILAAIVSSQKRNLINCKKMVFAPICRGVAAKRGDGRYKHQPQIPFPVIESNEYIPNDEQSPYWFYQTRLGDQTFP